MTSMEQELGQEIPMDEIKKSTINHFNDIFKQ